MLLKKIFLVFAVFIHFSFSTDNYEVLTKWKLAKQSNDIGIYYRFVSVCDTMTTRQMRVSFFVKATPDDVVEMFKDSDKLSKWSVGVRKCSTIRSTDLQWTMYSLYDIPWPFKQRDLITEYRMVKSDTSVKLMMTAKPNQLPHYPNIAREKHYLGSWIFKPMENGFTQVTFYSISFAKPAMPRIVQDPVIQNAIINSIVRLKRLLTQQ